VGWISTIRVLGDIFNIPGFYIWHLVMSILICAAWLILFAFTSIAFWRGEIFLAKSEDVLKDTMLSREEAEREKEEDEDSVEDEVPTVHVRGGF
jgi:homospermidine synthase